MNSKDFIDQVKVKHGLPSNYAAARLLGMTDQRISAYVRGRREFDDKTSLAVANALELSPGYVLAEIKAAREADPDVRKAWRAVAATLVNVGKKGQAAALFGFGIILMLNADIDNLAAELSANGAALSLLSIHYTH